jgi:hypothetical protein
MYIQAYNHHGLLVVGQSNADHNPLFNLAHLPSHTDTVAVTHKPTMEPPASNNKHKK